jgi:UDP-3-O-[3-hydroxymyristoyl] glucosamine N-acyltransferase
LGNCEPGILPAEIFNYPITQLRITQFGEYMKLTEIASVLGAKLVGSAEAASLEIAGVAGIEEAGPQQITFIANPKYAPAARTTRAAAIIVAPTFPALETPTLRSENPYLAFARALELFFRPPEYTAGVHPTAVIDPTAKIGAQAHIGAYVVIDAEVEIGDYAVLLPHVVIYRGARIGHRFFAHAHAVVREYCQLGNDVLLQNGAVIGSDGFGFAKDKAGQWHKIVQTGPAVLEDQVEVQANACVDRASVGQTRIGSGVKIDNLVQVGHGCEVGRDTLLCAQVGLAGSTVLGKNVILAGQVGVAGHCTIGDGAVVTAQSGTHGDIEPGKVVSGSPAVDSKQWLRCTAVYNRLPELAKSVRTLAETLEQVKTR